MWYWFVYWFWARIITLFIYIFSVTQPIRTFTWLTTIVAREQKNHKFLECKKNLERAEFSKFEHIKINHTQRERKSLLKYYNVSCELLGCNFRVWAQPDISTLVMWVTSLWVFKLKHGRRRALKLFLNDFFVFLFFRKKVLSNIKLHCT